MSSKKGVNELLNIKYWNSLRAVNKKYKRQLEILIKLIAFQHKKILTLNTFVTDFTK